MINILLVHRTSIGPRMMEIPLFSFFNYIYIALRRNFTDEKSALTLCLVVAKCSINEFALSG